MRVCVIGNSHVAALKLGWTQVRTTYPKVEITFFAHAGLFINYLKLEDSCLVPTTEDLRKAIAFTSGGQDRIRPEAFDCFLIYALTAKPAFARSSQFYSAACVKALANNLVANTASTRLLRELKEITAKRIHVGHDPLLAAQS